MKGYTAQLGGAYTQGGEKLDDVVALMMAVGEKIRPCDAAGTYILKKEEA